MSKFMVFSCSKVTAGEAGHNYSGNVAILANASDPSLVLFFPISEENAEMLAFVLNEDVEFDINTSSLGIYQTMIDSWASSDRYLSGIVLDRVYDPEIKDYIMEAKIALSTKYGPLDSVVKVNLVHAILLSVIEGIEIIVTNELLSKLMPDFEDEDFEDDRMIERNRDVKPNKSGNGHFPQDQNILKIVKNIMEAEEKPVPTTTRTTTTTLPKNTKSKKKTDGKDNKKK